MQQGNQSFKTKEINTVRNLKKKKKETWNLKSIHETGMKSSNIRDVVMVTWRACVRQARLSNSVVRHAGVSFHTIFIFIKAETRKKEDNPQKKTLKQAKRNGFYTKNQRKKNISKLEIVFIHLPEFKLISERQRRRKDESFFVKVYIFK